MTRISVYLLAASASICTLNSAPIIEVFPVNSTVMLNQLASIEIRVSGLGAGVAPSIGTYDLDFGFESTLLSFVSATYGTGLAVPGFGSIQFTTPGSGTVNLFELSLAPAANLNLAQPGSFTLATLTFRAVSLGNSGLKLTANAIGDAAGLSLSPSILSGSLTVSDVPEPAPVALLIVALGITVARYRDRRD